VRCLRDDGGLRFGNVVLFIFLFICRLLVLRYGVEPVRFIYVENRFQSPVL